MAHQHPRHLPIEAPVEVSQARLAAEAAFAGQPATSADQPMVVVKRKRSLTPSSDEKGAKGVPSSLEGVRTPKVFRIESASGTGDESNASSAPETSSDGVKPRRRRRSRVQSGEVTIIRPAPAPADDEPVGLEDPSTQDLNFPFDARSALRDYRTLMNEVEKLRQQVLAAKKAESAKALRWIRHAIAEYGLDASDLGL